MIKSAPEYTLAELAQAINAELIGDPLQKISKLATLQSAQSIALSFIANPIYKKYLASSQAGGVILAADLVDSFAGNKLVVANPYLAYAKLSAWFDVYDEKKIGVHETVAIGKNCELGADVFIDANAVIADGVKLGDGVQVGAGSYIGEDCVIGSGTKLYANVSIYHAVSVGKNCIFHSGAVIGADGFGFSPSPEGWTKIHQLGSVIIGDNVEIGANTCIDRGALDNTIIEDSVIIDNLVQIGHNVRLGKNTAIAAHTAIAGSTQIGRNCTIAGAVAIAGHLTLADKVHISGMSMVSSSIDEAGSYSSGIPLAPTKEWRKNAARFRQLDHLASRLIKLERLNKSDDDKLTD